MISYQTDIQPGAWTTGLIYEFNRLIPLSLIPFPSPKTKDLIDWMTGCLPFNPYSPDNWGLPL